MSKDLVAQVSEMEKVVELMHKGGNPTSIAREIGITRGKVLEHLDQWRKWASEDNDIRGRAKELVTSLDEHYQMILKEAWDIVDTCNSSGDIKEKTNALKLIAQVEKDRAAFFAQAGITADDALGEELAERERREEIIVELVKEIARDNPHLKVMIYKRLATLNGEAQVIPIEGETA